MMNLAKEYSDTPLGRFRDDGPYSGQRFREEFLLPKLSEDGVFTVDFDGVEGIGSSFLEEAFGGLVRTGHFSSEDLRNRLKIVFTDETLAVYEQLVWKYINAAKARTDS